MNEDPILGFSASVGLSFRDGHET